MTSEQIQAFRALAATLAEDPTAPIPVADLLEPVLDHAVDTRDRDQNDPLRYCRRVNTIALLETAYAYAKTFDF